MWVLPSPLQSFQSLLRNNNNGGECSMICSVRCVTFKSGQILYRVQESLSQSKKNPNTFGYKFVPPHVANVMRMKIDTWTWTLLFSPLHFAVQIADTKCLLALRQKDKPAALKQRRCLMLLWVSQAKLSAVCFTKHLLCNEKWKL